MLKREISYEDLDGNKVTDTFYFNLFKGELVDLELSAQDGFGVMLQRIIQAKNAKLLVEEFKKLILMSYGKKSEDGKRFIKSAELREEFSQTAAFDALFMELSTDETAAATFVQGVIPKDMSGVFAEALAAPVATAPLAPPIGSTNVLPPPPRTV
jgi:hypothetical protein